MELLDQSTGSVIDSSSAEPICIGAGRTKSFECTLRDVHPNLWSLSWLIEDVQEEGTLQQADGSADGLVHLSSRYTVLNPGKESRLTSLTCRATLQPGESQEVAVTLQFCYGKRAT